MNKKYLYLIIILAVGMAIAAAFILGRQSNKVPTIPENVAKDGVSASQKAVDDPMQPSAGDGFRATGNLRSSSSGWKLVYEKPGAPGLSADLIFNPSSVCGSEACAPAFFKEGDRVSVEGAALGEKVAVARLVFMK